MILGNPSPLGRDWRSKARIKFSTVKYRCRDGAAGEKQDGGGKPAGSVDPSADARGAEAKLRKSGFEHAGNPAGVT